MSYQDVHEAEGEQIAALLTVTSNDGLVAAKRRIDEALAKRAGEQSWRTKIMPDSWYANLDDGIRFPVRVLHAAGLETCQSCQGGDGHDWPAPGVDIVSAGGDAAGFAALAALITYGIDVLEVTLRWGIVDGLPTERVWRVTFRRAYPERAGEKPGFVMGCIAHPS